MKREFNAKFSNIMVYHNSQVDNTRIKMRILHTLAGECIADNIYLFSIENNTIYTIDKNTWKMEIQQGDETESLCEELLYVRSVKYKNFIFFISDRINSILKFDTNTFQKKIIHINRKDIEFSEPIIYKDVLYLLPYGFSEQIICINIETDYVSYYPTNYRLQLNQYIQNENILFGNAVVTDDCIYRGSWLGSYIQKFHMDSWEFEYIDVKDFNQPVGWMTFDGECFWLLSLNNGILARWNEKNNKVIQIIDLERETGKEKMLYAACKYINGSIYILEKSGSCILELKIKENILFSFDCINEISVFEANPLYSQAFSETIIEDSEGVIYFLPYHANGIVAKYPDNSVCFYKTTTTKILELADMQQVQNESICTLQYFCNIPIKKHKDIAKGISTGSSILNALKL